MVPPAGSACGPSTEKGSLCAPPTSAAIASSSTGFWVTAIFWILSAFCYNMPHEENGSADWTAPLPEGGAGRRCRDGRGSERHPRPARRQRATEIWQGRVEVRRTDRRAAFHRRRRGA